jgi:tetratricopeptide (TPR) repeat protein
MDGLTKEGIRAYQYGDRERAARLFARAIQLNKNDEHAWYWLSACVDDTEKKRYCLQRTLAINPDNSKARRRLERMDLFVQSPYVTQKLPPQPATKNLAFRIGAIVLSIVVILGVYYLFTTGSTQSKEEDLAAVLGAVDQAPTMTVPVVAVVIEPEEQAGIPVPITGEPVVIMGEDTAVTETFSLPAGNLKVLWQYNGHPEEDQNLQEVNKKHDANIEIITGGYQNCLDTNQQLLDFAILDQKQEEIERAEKNLEVCIQEYEKSKRLENLRYYDEIDYYSTSFSVWIKHTSGLEPISLVDVRGIYYGMTSFIASMGEGYYLDVTASGPWSVVFKLD